jgi:hypothetical protein
VNHLRRASPALPAAFGPKAPHWNLRKRWRYVAAFCDDLVACAARVQVGPLGQTFWAIWDRERRELLESTRMRLPRTRGEVWREGPIDRIDAREVQAELRFGRGRWVETRCENGDGNAVWTRKCCDVVVDGEVRYGDRRMRVDARGVVDETDGHHPRRTVWSWSAGVGEAADGRSIGWNLVAGINDPPTGSERAIWVDGEPAEPGPVTFEGLDAIASVDGERLEFTPEAERWRNQNLLVVRYRYRQPFGTFAGQLPGGIELAEGMGVMEHHDAVW